jgi:hypothetical protein
LRIPSRTLKGASYEEVVNDESWKIDVNLERMECRDTQISCITAESLQSHPRHDDLKKLSRQKAPKNPNILGRAIRCAPHREAFVPDVKSWVSRAGWQS